MSGAKMLSHLGWRKGEPWLQEVSVPAQMDWSLSGLQTVKTPRLARSDQPRSATRQPTASLILPQDARTPSSLPELNVYLSGTRASST